LALSSFSTSLYLFHVKASKIEKVAELKDELAAAKKAKNFPLCKLLAEAVEKQIEFDAALEANDFDSAERLSAEAPHTFLP
jgi:hypothetical protein